MGEEAQYRSDSPTFSKKMNGETSIHLADQLDHRCVTDTKNYVDRASRGKRTTPLTEEVIRRRIKQKNLAKHSDLYKVYKPHADSTGVPHLSRPRMPDIFSLLSNRAWNFQMSEWKKKIYAYIDTHDLRGLLHPPTSPITGHMTFTKIVPGHNLVPQRVLFSIGTAEDGTYVLTTGHHTVFGTKTKGIKG